MIYKYKTEGRSLKDFSNYQNPIDLFINLTDSNVNPRELLKNEIEFKSGLGGRRKENSKSKSEQQISVIRNVQNFFELREEIMDF